MKSSCKIPITVVYYWASKAKGTDAASSLRKPSAASDTPTLNLRPGTKGAGKGPGPPTGHPRIQEVPKLGIGHKEESN